MRPPDFARGPGAEQSPPDSARTPDIVDIAHRLLDSNLRTDFHAQSRFLASCGFFIAAAAVLRHHIEAWAIDVFAILNGDPTDHPDRGPESLAKLCQHRGGIAEQARAARKLHASLSEILLGQTTHAEAFDAMLHDAARVTGVRQRAGECHQ